MIFEKKPIQFYLARVFYIQSKKKILKETYELFYSFSRNFFSLICWLLTWLLTSKILPPLLYKKCRYDAWESIQDFDDL